MKELDLHGVKHENVNTLLDTFIWENMKQNAMGVKVITGNSPEMKRIVNEVVREYGFAADDSFTNPAALIISFI